MEARAACSNCGFVGFYSLPYRAKLTAYNEEDDKDSTVTLDNADKSYPWLCANCGRPALIAAYHDNAKALDPFKDSRVQII